MVENRKQGSKCDLEERAGTEEVTLAVTKSAANPTLLAREVCRELNSDGRTLNQKCTICPETVLTSASS